jgi:hypothetical protein
LGVKGVWDVIYEIRKDTYCDEMGISEDAEFDASQEAASRHFVGYGRILWLICPLLIYINGSPFAAMIMDPHLVADVCFDLDTFCIHAYSIIAVGDAPVLSARMLMCIDPSAAVPPYVLVDRFCVVAGNRTKGLGKQCAAAIIEDLRQNSPVVLHAVVCLVPDGSWIQEKLLSSGFELQAAFGTQVRGGINFVPMALPLTAGAASAATA